jgi:hypothetical protein
MYIIRFQAASEHYVQQPTRFVAAFPGRQSIKRQSIRGLSEALAVAFDTPRERSLHSCTLEDHS